MSDQVLTILGILMGIAGSFLALISLIDMIKQDKANNKVEEAEKEAFKDIEEELNLKKSFKELKELLAPLKQGRSESFMSHYLGDGDAGPIISREELAEQFIGIIESVEKSSGTLAMKSLFNVNSKQIEKYQVQTRVRATWSFMFAIFSMIAGLCFVIWGGSKLLTAKEPIVLAAGGIFSAIGGGVGDYITKTFLDDHKLSLNQLNRYFKQPVINDHILMAQRLANESNDPETKKKAYETVINSIAELIKQETEIKKE